MLFFCLMKIIWTQFHIRTGGKKLDWPSFCAFPNPYGLFCTFSATKYGTILASGSYPMALRRQSFKNVRLGSIAASRMQVNPSIDLVGASANVHSPIAGSYCLQPSWTEASSRHSLPRKDSVHSRPLKLRHARDRFMKACVTQISNADDRCKPLDKFGR